MLFYYTVSAYCNHDLELGETIVKGPFETAEERRVALDNEVNKPYNGEEFQVKVSLLESESPIRTTEQLWLTYESEWEDESEWEVEDDFDDDDFDDEE